MKKITLFLLALLLILSLTACQTEQTSAQVVASTQPVYEFATYICQNTDIHVEKLITESVSCLHDYSLKVAQMRTLENAELILLSGAGLEDFLEDALRASNHIFDTSTGVSLLCMEGHDDHSEHHSHHDSTDPHIWLSPVNAKIMAGNICRVLSDAYPLHAETFKINLSALEIELDILTHYAEEQLQDLPNKEIITFHDGFSYMADAFGLTIVHAIEEESGSEASAAELISLMQIIAEHQIDAIFTETNGSTGAASIIANETGISIYTLDMAMSEKGYFEAMYHNIDTLKEALQ